MSDRLVLFTHALSSCWNHGNAHFLRGVCRTWLRRGREVLAFEPADAWSKVNLARDHGDEGLDAWRGAYPDLAPSVRAYAPSAMPEAWLPQALEGAGVVLVHEWTEPSLVAAIGRTVRALPANPRPVLLFHDTHHRGVTAPEELDALDLSGFDGVLAFGGALRARYLERGWHDRVWTWHEAADPSVFRPLKGAGKDLDLVWVGNWGDGERAAELGEFLIGPVRRLGLNAAVHGVRYPDHALAALREAGIDHRGWLPNHRAPETFARAKATLHVPRRPYAKALPGIPTIRVFEALACGVPLVSGPWDDAEGLFPDGCYLKARDGTQAERRLRDLAGDAALREELATKGLAAIRARHTVAHRVGELEAVLSELGRPVAPPPRALGGTL